MSERMSKSGFLLSRSHVGRESEFSIKNGVIPTKSGWLDSLKFSYVSHFSVSVLLSLAKLSLSRFRTSVS